MCEPVGYGADEIAGGGGEGAFCALDDGVDAKFVGDGKSIELGNNSRNSLG